MSQPNENTPQVVYFSHGGGPLPLMDDPGHRSLVDFWQRLPTLLNPPKAILVVSAHWEEEPVAVLAADQPPLFFDYYGFPPATYQIGYPAPGNPALAEQVVQTLSKAGIACRKEMSRGFDHGMFIPLLMMYPQAEIPVVQLSLQSGLDAAENLALGKALRGLECKDLLVIGSGFSFHNMQAFWNRSEQDPANDAFQDWLLETCTAEMEQVERETRLLNWEQAPHARYCHPREEHLLPLHVCLGLADKPARVLFDDQILGKRGLGFLWE